MMGLFGNSHLQAALFAGSVATLIFIIYVIKKHKMSIKYSIIWIVWTILILLLSIFPGIIGWIARVLSIYSPVNTVFLVVMFLIYIISFYAYLKISLQERQISDLNYRLSVLQKAFEESAEKRRKQDSPEQKS